MHEQVEPGVDKEPSSLKDRLRAFFEEHGLVAFLLWWLVFGTTLMGAYTLISLGFVEEGEGGAGVWAAAYVLTQLTKPVRIAIVLGLTPLVSWVRRERLGQE